MKIQAKQTFEVPLAGPQDAARAIAFVQAPDQLLSRLRFLHGLQVASEAAGTDQQGVSGELVVQVPALDRVDLPFRSLLMRQEDGARLEPLPLTNERAWVEVTGQAQVQPQMLRFEFEFVAHLALPEMPGWGGAAFEKMVVAAAGRTLERVAQELPRGVAEAWAGFEG